MSGWGGVGAGYLLVAAVPRLVGCGDDTISGRNVYS